MLILSQSSHKIFPTTIEHSYLTLSEQESLKRWECSTLNQADLTK